MANEFVARNGLIALDASRISGSSSGIGVGSSILEVVHTGSASPVNVATFRNQQQNNVRISLVSSDRSFQIGVNGFADGGSIIGNLNIASGTPTLRLMNANETTTFLSLSANTTTGVLTAATSASSALIVLQNNGLITSGTLNISGSLSSSAGFNLSTVGNGYVFESVVSSSTDASIRFRRGSDNGWVRLALGNNSSGQLALETSTGELRLFAGGGGYFPTIYSNGVERARITTGGNFLYNTTSSLGYDFDVNGTGNFRNNITITGSLTTTGNITTTGTITAQTLVVQTVTSSIDFVTGSTRFGTLLSNTHQFTGSVSMTGSLTSNGNITIANPNRLFLTSDSTSFLYSAGSNQMIIGINASANSSVNIFNGGVRIGSSTNDQGFNILDGGYASINSAANSSRMMRIESAGSQVHLVLSRVVGNFLEARSSDLNTLYAAVTSTGGALLSGSVAIGKMTATSQLDVLGNTLITGSLGITGSSFTIVGNNIGVGIGTNTPTGYFGYEGSSNKIEIRDTVNNLPSINLRISAQSASIGLQNNSWDFRSSNPVQFTQAGTNTIYLGTNGRVGIGTQSPDTFLQINSTSTTGSTITLNAQGTGNATVRHFRGNVFKFEVGSGGGSDDYGIYNGAASSYSIRIKSTAGGDIYLNETTGSTGIGTTSPTSKLDVNGTATFRGDTVITGSFTVVTGSARELQVTPTGVNIGSIVTDIHTVTGSLNVSGSITGSLFGTASFAITASHALNAGGSAPTAVTFNRVTGSYTFVLTDAGKTVEVSGSTATSHSLTVPSSSTANFANGTYIDVVLYGTGSILFTTASTSVTLRSANNWNRMGTRYGAATLIKISGDEWYLIGNLNA